MKSEKKTIVVLTGAGISQESGLKTFRDEGGLWEGHSIYEVATPEAFERDPETVHRFYNLRRAQLKEVAPNAAHFALKKLETPDNDVFIITQNVDDLHERAGSSQVIHLHGEIRKARSVRNPGLIIPCEDDLTTDSSGPDGARLRPHIVWFGEEVPELPRAAEICARADVLLIVGTSLLVYPAAGLWRFAPEEIPVFLVDPNPSEESARIPNLHIRATKAADGVPHLVEELLNSGF